MRSPFTSPTRGSKGRRGFSLVEMLVATAVLVLIMAMIASFTSQTGKIWKRSAEKIQTFQGARAAYDAMTSHLAQATLNTYLDYYDGSLSPRTPATAATFVPSSYARNSDLHFVVDRAAQIVPDDQQAHPGQAVFFLAPLGFTQTSATFGSMPNMLNACGYYVEFNSDRPNIPHFLANLPGIKERYRYRLMEFMQPTESLGIYSLPTTGGATQYDKWFTNFLPPNVSVSQAPLRMMAENIVALVILPELSSRDRSGTGTPLAPLYTYDSRAGDITTAAHHQLPPLLRVVMVAIDETAAARLTPPGTTAPPAAVNSLLSGNGALFQTASQIDADLATLSSTLTGLHVNYRIFDTDIAIRGARWSTQ